MPDQFVWVDGRLVPWDAATIHITQVGPAGVSSVFEGIRAYANPATHKLWVLQLEAHLARLAQSMRLMRMKVNCTPSQIRDGILELLRANACAGDTYIRPMAFVEGTFFGSAQNNPARLVANTSSFPSHLKSGQISHAAVSSWTRLADNVMPPRVKASSNYLNSRLAGEEAKRNGYDAAILLNAQGRVAEAPGACLMIVRQGRVITPSTSSGILESITRASFIQLLREVLSVDVVERDLDRTELYVADEAFLCGTGSELTPIVSVDRLPVGDGQIGPITRRMEDLYHDLVRGIDPRYPEWRTAVESGE